MQASNPCAEDIALHLDRARVYRGLAQLFRMPDAESLRTTRDRELPELCQALERLTQDEDLIGEARTLCDLFEDTAVEKLRQGHQRAFDESSGTRCAPTEMDQLGEAPQLQLTRTFEMADVAGFYKAFGVEAREGGERGDHIITELEFMNLLAVKQAIALQDEGEGEHAEVCRDASRAFLRDHLGRWAPRLGECLAAAEGDPIYCSTGRLLNGFVEFDAQKIDAAGAPLHRVAIKDA